jgi:AraC-like DNA-binding protein
MINSRLDLIRNWPVLAQTAGFCVTLLALQCSVSTRQLQRFAQEKMACSAHQWLRKLRMQRAVVLLQRQFPLKQIANELGYSSAAHFSRDFKGYYGMTPGQFTSQAAISASQTTNVAFLQ